MNIFTNYLEKLGSNFLVSAMVPSLALVVFSILVFNPIIQVAELFQQENSTYQLVGFGLLVFLLTVIIGFTLTALNTYILKLFEGYIFFHRVPYMYKWMISNQKRRAGRLIRKRTMLKKRIQVLEENFDATERSTRVLRNLRRRYYSVVAEYDHSFPPNLGALLPTKFGNILKASESYPGTRYGLDGVEFWPRLIHVVPTDYQQKIENTRNELSFLVNMSILSITFFLLCSFAMVYFLTDEVVVSGNLDGLISVLGESFRYAIAGLIALGCNFFFNRAAIYSVGSFGLMIRSAYDLFRLDLLKQFKLRAPTDSINEFFAWKNLNEFIVLGTHSLNFKKLHYRKED